MASSFPTSPSFSTLPKINRIQKGALTSEEQPLQRSTKTACSDVLPRTDYLNIYKGLTVLFVEDNSMRTLYRDLSKVFPFSERKGYTRVKYS
jgi:hypothetical protein